MPGLSIIRFTIKSHSQHVDYIFNALIKFQFTANMYIESPSEDYFQSVTNLEELKSAQWNIFPDSV